ncbi:hypothetical protein [Burkholderia sp. 22PA0106]|uniref:hypothetical protein n=1 Tax=Burkholderia sp. 22PA0106 TaxID=3237371 RepID=UPI0039C2151E
MTHSIRRAGASLGTSPAEPAGETAAGSEAAAGLTPPPARDGAARPVVHRLGPDALASLQRARGKPAEAERPSLKARVAGALSGRQFAVTAGVPGTSHTVNGPLRAGVPGQTHAGVAGPPGPLGAPVATTPDADRDPVLDDARKLLALADAMAGSLDQPSITVYERPHESAANRAAKRLVPWLAPTPLKDIASFSAGRGMRLSPPGSRKDPVLARGRLDNEQQARRLLQGLAQRRTALDAAVAEVGAARAALAATDVAVLAAASRAADAGTAGGQGEAVGGSSGADTVANPNGVTGRSPGAGDATPTVHPTARLASNLAIDPTAGPTARLASNLAIDPTARLTFNLATDPTSSAASKATSNPTTHPTPNPALAAQAAARTRLRIAELAARDAGHALHEAIHGTELLELVSLGHLSDRADQTHAFALRRLDDLKSRIYTLRDDAGSRRKEIDIALRLHARQAETLVTLGDEMNDIDLILCQAQARIDSLGKQQAALADGSSDSADSVEAGIVVARISEQIGAAHGVLAEAQAQKARCEARLGEFSERHADISRLMQERSRVEARWQAADRAVPSLLKASLALAEQGEQADRVERAEAQASPDAAPGSTGAQREQAAIAAAREAQVAQLIDAGNVYGAEAPAGLQAALRTLAERLTAPAPPLPLPPSMTIEIVTRAMADTGVEASNAAPLLAHLGRQPAAHWVSLAAGLPERTATAGAAAASTATASAAVASAAASADPLDLAALAVCRKLASLPRGTDLLHALSSEGAAAPDAARSQALRVFWNAEEAQRADAVSPDIAAWLQQAKTVARGHLAGDPAEAFDDVDHAAYNAVRNGYLSNAPGSPYAQHVDRLNKAITEWVVRAGASAPDGAAGARPSAWRRAMPNLNKTPFRRRVLKQAYRVGESMGMQSARIQVDQHVRQRIAHLEGTLAACRTHGGSPELRRATAAAQATVEYLKQLQQRGQHPSQIRLDAGDRTGIGRVLGEQSRRERGARAARNGEPNRLRKTQAVDLPEPLHTACGSGLSAYEAIDRIETHLAAQLPASLRAETGETADAAGLDAALRLLKSERFADKTDILAFFQPFIANSRLRDRVRIGGGGTLGVNLPTLPYGASSPIVSPIFTAEKSVGDEAFVQMFMPILGMEMSFGTAHTSAQEATAGVAVGPQVAPGVALQAAFTARAASQRTDTHSTVVRFLRSRHKDDEMRANMVNALDSLVRWDLIAPARGRAYRDPLEAVFARNPAVVVAQLDAVTRTQTLTGRLSARLPSARFNDAHGVAQTLGADASLFVEAERTRDKRSETGGQVRIGNAKGDTAQQRAGVAANLNFAPLTNQSVPVGEGGRHGAVQRESVPMQIGVTRDLAWIKAQHEISPFTIGDKQDADLDRHYATPREMLAEIDGNREAWLMRCIETLDADASGEKDTPANRERAAILLGDFEREIRGLGETSHYCHYNVNYSMRGEAGVWIDGYRALAELAEQRGDAAGAEAARRAIDEVLAMRATWRPLMLIVRERSRESSVLGWRSLLRWQRVANVDGQRTAAQFPPP